MRRWIPIVILVTVALLFAVLLLVYFAYGVRDSPPNRARVAGLSGPVEIEWHRDDHATIVAAADTDLVAGIGYAHGMRRAWTVTLWRQTAAGRLAEWFGEKVLPIDALARRLGLARLAMRSYEDLDDGSRALLDAYTRGMNAALRDRGARANELAALGLSPEPWEPWHTLAIERLIAWLATTPLSVDTLHTRGGELTEFARQDSLLRRFLHLGGFAYGAAWTTRDSASVVLMQRHITGASAVPLFYELELQRGDSTLLTGASLPGTPFVPAGRAGDTAWSVLLHGDARLLPTAVQAAQMDTLYDRIVLLEGDERLLKTTMYGNAIVLGLSARLPAPAAADSVLPTAITDSLGTTGLAAPPAVPAPDSVWLLTWPGLETGTDLLAWRALTQGEAGDFRLVRGSGLALTREGEVRVLGNPVVNRTYSGGIFISNADLTAHAASRLDSISAAPRGDDLAETYLEDCESVWAQQLAPQLVAAVDSTYSHERFMEEALTYLRNWDFSYDRTSIAATIFDSWLSAHRDSAGYLPRSAELDTSAAARHRLYSTLVGALNQLANRHGTDMSQWRWEVAAPHTFYFPVWSADSLQGVRGSVLPGTRYAPIDVAGEGHPTTLCWGPSPVVDVPPYPGRWESWISTGSWDQFLVRRRRLHSEAFLARYRIPESIPPPVMIEDAGGLAGRTRLEPAP